MPAADTGVFSGTAQKTVVASRVGTSAEGDLKRIVSVSPRAVTPARCLARPAR